MSNRRFAFLGHARPEDNAFTLWLGSRLTAAGYEPWSDLVRLPGGETFWNDVTAALTAGSAVYLPILSSASVDPERRGFHDEVALAISVMRRGNLRRFVMPLLLDQVQAPIPLIQLNHIDFTRGWAAGLRDLLRALEEAGVPRSERPSGAAMAAWRCFQASLAGAATVVERPEVITTNWFRLDSLPPRVRLLGSPLPLDLWEKATKGLRVPHARHGEHVVTFASAACVQEALGARAPVREARSVRTEQFMEGRTGKGGPVLAAGDARRMVAAMLNRGWEGLAASRGLVAHELASTRCWYFPSGLLDGDRARYVGPNGKRTYRAMVGRKGKLGTLWHYALSGWCELREPQRLVLRAHVLFSQRGAALLADRKKVQRLRRSLCSDWWNAEWRDRLRAAVAHLSEGKRTLRLPLGDAWASVVAEAVAFDSAASFQRPRREDEGEATEDAAFDEEARAVAEMPDSAEEDEG